MNAIYIKDRISHSRPCSRKDYLNIKLKCNRTRKIIDQLKILNVFLDYKCGDIHYLHQ